MLIPEIRLRALRPERVGRFRSIARQSGLQGVQTGELPMPQRLDLGKPPGTDQLVVGAEGQVVGALDQEALSVSSQTVWLANLSAQLHPSPPPRKLSSARTSTSE